MPGRTQYRIESDDPRDWKYEINRILQFVSDRLDQMEGFRGTPRVYNNMKTDYDVVVLNSNKGLVLTDNGDPAHYWRLSINQTGTTGTLTITDLGASYGG